MVGMEGRGEKLAFTGYLVTHGHLGLVSEESDRFHMIGMNI